MQTNTSQQKTIQCPLENTEYANCCLKMNMYDEIQQSDKQNCTFVEHCTKLKGYLEHITKL